MLTNLFLFAVSVAVMLAFFVVGDRLSRKEDDDV